MTNQTMNSAVTPSSAALGRSPLLREAAERVLQGNHFSRQQVVELDKKQMSLLRSELVAFGENLVTRYLRRAKNEPSPKQQIVKIIKDASSSVKITGFGDPKKMAILEENLDEAMNNERPVVLAMLMGGAKASNQLKTGFNVLPDATEWIAVMFLRALAQAISTIYPPGARIVIIPDAGLHTGDLAVPYSEVQLHLAQFKQDLGWLAASEYVILPDTATLLPVSWPSEVLAEASIAAKRIAEEPDVAVQAKKQAYALVFSMNTLAFNWTDEHAALVYSGIANGFEGVPNEARRDALALYDWAERITPHYIGTNSAIRTLDLAGVIVEQLYGFRSHIRMSVHAKPGEPRPTLIASSSIARHTLLPMHGVAVRDAAAKALKIGNAFELEARISSLIPAIDKSSGRFVFYTLAGQSVF